MIKSCITHSARIKIILGTVGLGMLTAISFLSGCARDQAHKLVLAENNVPVAAVTIIAYEKGYFREQGLNVEIEKFTSGKLALDAVVGGAADIATVAETPLMRAGLAGQDVKVIATTEFSDVDIKVLARKSAHISQPSDLRGKKIATLVGTSAEFFTSKFLNSHGLSITDVQVTNLPPADMVTSIKRGDIDAIFIWEPYIFRAAKLLGDDAVSFDSKGIYTETFNIALKNSLLTAEPKSIESFLVSLIKAEGFIKQNRIEAISIVAQRVGMDQEVLEQIWDDFHFEVFLDSNLANLIVEEAHWAIAAGTAPDSKLSVDELRKLIDSNLLRQIDKKRVRL